MRITTKEIGVVSSVDASSNLARRRYWVSMTDLDPFGEFNETG